MKKIIFLLIFIASLGCSKASAGLYNIPEPLDIKQQDRILILAPHPDDEAIACAGLVQQALNKKATVKVAYLTNGENNELAFIVYKKSVPLHKNQFINLGKVRSKEAVKAMGVLGLNENDLVFLGYPDSGTFAIFSQYWQTDKSFRSILTRINAVPYQDNLSFGSAYTGENLLRDLKKIILDFRPNKIFVSHPFDTNPDHKALYLFLEIALADIKDIFGPLEVYSYPVHIQGWPMPRRYHPNLPLEIPRDYSYSDIDWAQISLTGGQVDKKHETVLCYRSQTESSAFYLLAFVRKNELFGRYPPVILNTQLQKPAAGNSVYDKALDFFKVADNLSEHIPWRYTLARGSDYIDYRIEDGALVITTNKPVNIKCKLKAVVYLFGYNYSKDFSSMPKLTIIMNSDKIRIFDKKKELPDDVISSGCTSAALTVKVPLGVLGDPDFILASVRNNRTTQTDISAFRKIVLIKE